MNAYKLFIAVCMIIAGSMTAKAQPSTVKNVHKSVFTLTTYASDGSIIATSHGVFIGSNGEAAGELSPFIGASKAVATDYSGNQLEVTHIIGINSIYNVAKFRVGGKTTPARMATTAATAGSRTWLVGYGQKNPEITESTIKSVETFMEQYAYYIYGMNAPDNTAACPFVNDNGEVLGLMQISNTSFDTHATDVRYINSLALNALSYADPDIRKIGIPLAMPTDQSQAQLALMMASQSGDSLKYVSAINDFISLFPTLTDGYSARARLQMSSGQFDEAAETMENAIKKADKKDAAHFEYSKLIYDKELYSNGLPYEKWSLDKALEEARAAYAISPQAIYRHQEAQIVFSKGNYQEAYDMFSDLYNDPSFRSPELLYEAARCKQMLNAPAREVIVLLDSAINTTDTLRFAEAAPYYLARAVAYEQADSFRQAVFDYTRYEILMQGRVGANFYYTREQAEVKSRLFQQALADIARAIILDPQEATYYAEMASLQLRVNMTDEAIKTAQRCTEIAPEYSDGYLLLGLAQIRKEMKAEGLANLQKAGDMGNPQAAQLIEKYSK